MNERELLQRLVVEVVNQRAIIGALVGLIAAERHPDPDRFQAGGYQEVVEDLARMHRAVLPKSVESLQTALGYDPTTMLQALDPTGQELESWFRRQFPEEQQ